MRLPLRIDEGSWTMVRKSFMCFRNKGTELSSTRISKLKTRLGLERLEHRVVFDTCLAFMANPIESLSKLLPDASESTVVVRLSNSLDTATTVEIAGEYGKRLPGQSNWISLRVPSGRSLSEFRDELQNDPRVLAVSEVQYVGIAGTNQFIPNDTSFTSLYGMHNTGQIAGAVVDADIDAPEAWDTIRGSTSVVVAGIDTGVDYEHVDLYKNIWLNPGEIPASRRANLVDTNADGKITFWDLNEPINQGIGKISDANNDGRISGSDVRAPMVFDGLGQDTGLGGWANGVSDNSDSYVDDVIGWNFVTNNNDPMDDHGHGTHTAGTMAAMGDNGLGVAGILHKAQVMAIKFMGSNGQGTNLAAALAIEYSAALGAKISNNSWGDNTYSSLIEASISFANSLGSIFVAAAGNAAKNTDTTAFYPASLNLPNVVSVAATDSKDLWASFSNYGVGSVDLGAPGVGIFSTIRNNAYGMMSGTSMAAPHVAAVAAAVMSLHPDWTGSQVIARLLSSVDLVPALNGKTATGGRLNFSKAVDVSSPDQPGSGVDLKILSATFDGSANVQITYEVVGADVPEFEIGFYRSTDSLLGNDQQ